MNAGAESSGKQPPVAPVRELPPLRPGTLYLVATPIGNLEDITLRAIRVLRDCDVVAAEDTRRSAQLLQHLGFRKPLVSCHHFNEARRSEELLERMRSGAIVALVSDAGTPGISDPGERLVRRAIDAGLRVEPVPGACALIAALTASGLPTREFHFCGFLPHKGAARRKLLEKIGRQRGTCVLYESPHRLGKLIADIAALWPARRIAVARELTKRFEEIVRGPASVVHGGFEGAKVRGECVVLLDPLPEDDSGEPGFTPEICPDSVDSSDPAPT